MAVIARKKGYKAQVREDYLLIDGIRYSCKNLDSLPRNLQDIKHHSMVTDTQISFLGFRCPLSNFYQCSCIHNDETYTSSEQFIQYTKASMFVGNEDLITRIKSSHDVLHIKYLGQQVKNFDERQWKEQAMDLIQPGLVSKFMQNPDALDYLERTGTRKIVEANATDTLFGIGQGFSSDGLNNTKTQGSGRNIQGQMLEAVRKELCQPDEY